MNRAASFAIFFSTFFTLQLGLNYYLTTRFAELLGVEVPGRLSIIILLATSFLIANWLESMVNNNITNIIYRMAAGWLGISLLLFLLLLLFDLFNSFLPLDRFISGQQLLAAGVILSLYAVIRGQVLRVKRLKLRIPGVKVRIAHLSDLHLGPVHGREYLQQVVELVNSEQPDLICITGDLVDGPGELPDDLLVGCNELRAPIFYSLGNHEQYVGVARVEQLLKKTNIQLLRNEEKKWKGMTLIGIDDSEDQQQVQRNLRKVQHGILLYHRPDSFEHAVGRGVKLMLCGHTHAGQLFPFSLLVKLRFKRIVGLFQHKGAFLHVSPGTGTWGPPMRFGSRSEIAIIDVV